MYVKKLKRTIFQQIHTIVKGVLAAVVHEYKPQFVINLTRNPMISLLLLSKLSYWMKATKKTRINIKILELGL